MELYLHPILWRVLTSIPDSLGLEDSTVEKCDEDLSTRRIISQDDIHCCHARLALHTCRVVDKRTQQRRCFIRTGHCCTKAGILIRQVHV